MQDTQELMQENTAVEQPEQQEEQLSTEQQLEPQQAHKAQDALNARRLREKAERAERERDELLRKLQEMQQLQQPSNQADDEINLAPDDLAEGKHLTKMGRKVKKLEEQLQQYQQQASMSAAEVKLRSQYPDFDSVVSHDNVSLLRELYPEIAATLNSSPDLYSKAVSAYTLIKKLGITPQDQFAHEKAIAQKNAAKPRPLSAVAPQQGDSPLSRANAFANGLTEDLKEQLRREMFESMKNR